MKKELENIVKDNYSGSEELSLKLISYFEKNLEFIDNPVEEIEELKKPFQDFAGVIEFLNLLQKEINSAGASEAIKFLSSYREEKTSRFDKLYSNAKPFLHNKKHILTLSNSNTLFEILRRHSKEIKEIEVTVCESRPILEGRILAEKLADEGIEINFITEAMLPKYVMSCDLAIIGADKILGNGDIVNKTSSLNLAILCKYYQKPIIAVALKNKIAKDFNYEEEPKSPDEIWDINHNKIEITNKYFEEIPKTLLTKVITD